MAPRRSHKKSRTGCQKCKRRRIKCDEVHPSCGNCLKHAIICDFSLSPEEQRAVSLEFQSAPRAAAGGQAKSSSSSAASPLLLPPPPPPPPQLQQHSLSHPSPVHMIVQQSSNLPTLGLMVSGNMPSPAPSQVYHQHSPGAHEHCNIPSGTSEAPSVSPITSSTIGPSSSSSGGGGNTTDTFLHQNIHSKESPHEALPSPSPSSTLSSSSFATSTNQSVVSSVNLRIPTAHPPTLNVLDLSLMHHWSIYTVDSMSNRDHIQQIWRLNVPTLAVHHPFLMHALLAISAMHLHYKGADPSESSPYLSVASHHHECAVRGMAGCLAHISRDNCDALFIASSLVVIYSFVASRIDEVCSSGGSGSASASSGSSSNNNNSHSPTQIASWVPLIRGVHSILKQAWSWVNSGPLSPLFTQYDRSPSSEGLDPETESVIQSLYRLCTDRTLPGSNELSDIATSTAYFSAIAELRRTFATISAWGSIIGSIFVWPVTANDKYVELLVERRPRALVIFMHYCALFSLVEEFWWSQGSALFELRRCEQCLADEWLPWIEWPRLRILAGDLSVVVGGGGMGSKRLPLPSARRAAHEQSPSMTPPPPPPPPSVAQPQPSQPQPQPQPQPQTMTPTTMASPVEQEVK